jgi:hypothetical protein
MQMYRRRRQDQAGVLGKLRGSIGWVLASVLVMYLWVAAALGLVAG